LPESHPPFLRQYDIAFCHVSTHFFVGIDGIEANVCIYSFAYGLFSRSDEHIMKTRFNLFRRAGAFYTEDTTSGKQTNLRNQRRNRGQEPA
jgi:hypothetical protein